MLSWMSWMSEDDRDSATRLPRRWWTRYASCGNNSHPEMRRTSGEDMTATWHGSANTTREFTVVFRGSSRAWRRIPKSTGCCLLYFLHGLAACIARDQHGRVTVSVAPLLFWPELERYFGLGDLEGTRQAEHREVQRQRGQHMCIRSSGTAVHFNVRVRGCS